MRFLDDLKALDDARLQKELEAAQRRVHGIRHRIVDLRQKALEEESQVRELQDEITRRIYEARAERGE